MLLHESSDTVVWVWRYAVFQAEQTRAALGDVSEAGASVVGVSGHVLYGRYQAAFGVSKGIVDPGGWYLIVEVDA